MGIFRSISGMLSVEIVSADIPALLAAMAEQGIRIFRARTKGELTLELLVRRRDWRSLSALCKRRGESARIKARRGIYWPLKSLLDRPLLLAGLGILLSLMLFLPTRVLFIRVDGNGNIPAARILEAAADCGIRFGASRREVRSERVKNALLEAVPQLRWAGVNTYGCVAVISVREREEETAANQGSAGVSGIFAACDGIILTATATQGTCLCRPGQAVTKGELLISGYTDLGITIRATRAQGEVFAQTRRQIRAVTLSQAAFRGEEQEKDIKFTLLIGKKRINLWKGSGIWEGSCGRMYEEYYITLPGGFQLPIALIKETVTYYETSTAPVDPEEVRPRLERYAESCLLGQLVSGVIVSRDGTFTRENDLWVLEEEYLCTEMIGRQRQEGIGE